MKSWQRLLAVLFANLLAAALSWPQSNADIERLAKASHVSGYEQAAAKLLFEALKKFSPRTDNLGNVYVTMGSGSPHRLIVTPMDEPGYVVSGITPDGYLRVQRLPQAPPNKVFDKLHFAQPVRVSTRSGKDVPGVFAGLSVHLQPGRADGPKMNHPEELFVDIGASSEAEVRKAGVEVLDPVALNRETQDFGETTRMDWNPTGDGGRFGTMALLKLLAQLPAAKIAGTLTVAFVAQQSTGGRGLDRLLNEVSADEMIFVGRIVQPLAGKSGNSPEPPRPDSGVLLGVADAANVTGLAAELGALADAHKIVLKPITAVPPRIFGYSKTNSLPTRFAQLGVPSLWPATPAETVSYADVHKLVDLLQFYITGSDDKQSIEHVDSRRPTKNSPTTLSTLVEAYGASGHETAVRETVKALLPKWAKPATDAAGNLVLHLGNAKPAEHVKTITFVAHMDELGYEVKSIEPDGHLLAEVLGGGYTEYFLGHPALVHTAKGKIDGVMELPGGWEQPGFEWPRGAQTMDEPAHVYVGTHSAEETSKLGIAPGDWVTIPKEYRPLLGTRANGRSFDDRVGCAALIEAVRALGPELPGRDVTFVWSTQEEVGLFGAAAYAEQAAKENRVPDFVFAIDTFVSSDSPLESKRFADAKLGKGFVIRAVDNSNIAPREYVDRVVKLARENNIPVQYGVTGGGNDGSVFTRYGSVDIPMGWPLRYSHSPAEVIDTRDADALAKIIAIVAKRW